MMERQDGGGSTCPPTLPVEKAAHASLSLCRGSRCAYARPRCLWLPQRLLAQHDHDEDATIGTCVREGKLAAQVSKGTESREADERRVTLYAGSSRARALSSKVAAIAQVCALRRRQGCMCARSAWRACGPAGPDDRMALPLTSLDVGRFNPKVIRADCGTAETRV